MYGEMIAEYHSYPLYGEGMDKPNFWTYVKVFNPFNVIVGIGFICWVIYDNRKEKKRNKNKPKKIRNKEHEGIYADIHRATQEAVKRTLEDDVNDAHDRFFNEKNDTKVVDWNKKTLDELADYLENKWRFMSSGEAYSIMRMVEFYKKHKNDK